MQTNQQFDLCLQLTAEHRNQPLSDRKSRNGKNDLFKRLKEVSPKRMIVVAPTGVAAINAGGVTIHSFFQLPFGPLYSVFTGISGEEKQISKTNSARIKSISSAAWTYW